MKTSITHKHLTPTLFLEDNDPNSAKSAAQKLSLNLQSVTKHLRLTLVLPEIAHYGKSLFSIFQEFFARIDKILILAGRLHTRVSFYEV